MIDRGVLIEATEDVRIIESLRNHINYHPEYRQEDKVRVSRILGDTLISLEERVNKLNEDLKVEDSRVNVKYFSVELQNEISQVRHISFAGIQINTFPHYASEDECNLVILKTEHKITVEDLRELRDVIDFFDIDRKYIFITSAPYGVEIFNLAPKWLDVKTFLEFSHQFAVLWADKYNIDIEEYHVQNYLFDMGFHID